MIQYMPREADNKYYNSNLMKAPDFSRNSINIENAHPNGCALASEKSPHIFGQLAFQFDKTLGNILGSFVGGFVLIQIPA